ncbi:DUF1616 domain-containing protein [Halorussus sp. MSC15.2]|uniref:DUF1616 domain-containing protein n=1 Tax=Halorussus sp. MSC15.2 TaxID=2283638 RepID=UPI0013D3D2AA|nr:DUF1616 domain-containing protein [Halorussus sp. MSC15.2]NEU56522.1 DUF1616 domain-containing protein [Halorussus sp. MSC15.2]
MSHGTTDETLVDRLARPTLPLDLLAIVGYAVVAVALLSRPGVYGSPLGVAVGLPLVLFAPGYALVALLFPGATPDDAAVGRTLAAVRQHGLVETERAALGFGLSLAVLPILGVALAVSPWAIDPGTVLLSVAALTVSLSAAAGVRRLRRPADRRFALSIRAWADGGRRAVSTGSLADRAVNVGLAAAVVVAVAAVGYAVAAPGDSQEFTGVSLLSQNETGELVADDYPENFERGESRPLVVELANQEGEQTSYSVVVELQRVRQADDGGAKVVEDRTLATFTPTVGAGQEWRTTHEVTPTMTGEDLRLVYLVYEGDPPADPTTENAYRNVHVWVNVSA